MDELMREIREFYVYYNEYHRDLSRLGPVERPVARLEQLESSDPDEAGRLLQIDVNEIIVSSFGWPKRRLEAMKRDLKSRSLVSIARLQDKIKQDIGSVLQDGTIRSEIEYYLCKESVDANLAFLTEDDVDKLTTFMMIYENQKLKALRARGLL